MNSNLLINILEKLKAWIFSLLILSAVIIIPIYWYNGIVNSIKNEEFVDVDCFLELHDGNHVAEVDYYNPNTGTRSKYTLFVEVQNNELLRIFWPNGGYLDDFEFVEFDSGGYCSFTTDKEYEYNVQITDLNYNK